MVLSASARHRPADLWALAGALTSPSGRHDDPLVSQTLNWLRVLGTAELSQIDQGVRQPFHAKMALLPVFKPKQQPLEFVLPRKGPIDTGS